MTKPSFAQVTAAVKSIFRKSLTTSSLKKHVANSLKIDESILNEPNYDNLIKIQERLYSKKKSKRKPVVVKAKEDPICSQEIPPSPAIIKQKINLPQRTPVQQMMKENVLKKRKFEDVESEKSRKRMRVEKKIKELTPKDMNARIKKMDLPAKSPLAKWALSTANEIFTQASARFDEEIRKRKAAYIAGARKNGSAPKESPIIEANLAKSEQTSVIKKPEPAPRIQEQKEDSVLEPPVPLGHKRDTAKTNEQPPALEADASEEERSSESKSDSSEIKISEVPSANLEADLVMEEAEALEVKVAEIIEEPVIVQTEEEKVEPEPKVMEVKEHSEPQSEEKVGLSQVISEVQSADLETDVIMEEVGSSEVKVVADTIEQPVQKEEENVVPKETEMKVLHSKSEEEEIEPSQVEDEIFDLQQEEAPGILILDDDPAPAMEEDEQESSERPANPKDTISVIEVEKTACSKMEEDEQELSEHPANPKETMSVIEVEKTDTKDVEGKEKVEKLSPVQKLQIAVSQPRVECNAKLDSSNSPETKSQSNAEETSCKNVSTDVENKFVKKKSKVVVMSHLDLPKKTTPVRSFTNRITDLTKTSPIIPAPIKSLLKKTNKKDNAAQTPRRVKFTIPTDAPLGGGKYSRFKKSKRKQPPKPLKDEEVEERIRRGKIQRERKKARGNGFSPRYQSPSSNGKRRPKKNLSPLLSSVPLQRDKIKRLAGKARSNMLQETLKKGNYRKPERPKTERRYGRGKRLVASATKSAKLKKL